MTVIALTRCGGRSLKPMTLRFARSVPVTELINSGSSHVFCNELRVIEISQAADGFAIAGKLHLNVLKLLLSVNT